MSSFLLKISGAAPEFIAKSWSSFVPTFGAKAQSIVITGAAHSGELPCSLAVGSYFDL